MEAAFTGFLGREKFYLSLKTAPFAFDRDQDLLVDEAGNDPGVYNRAHELLRSYQSSHRFAVIALDNAWSGSPGVEKIQSDITENMISSGWARERFVVIVLNPELEAWVLQDHPLVAQAFRFSGDLRAWLNQKGLWEDGQAKAKDPKEAIEQVLKFTHTPRSSAIYKQITGQVSVKSCVDPAFGELRGQLQTWFGEV
ncbi:MAG: hypothetical protein VKN60_10460 [Cyanobacteriota bacterium]|nr:hypothetical protein [Cyanobacteriota bacterium]